MPTNKQRREAERRHLERQLQNRRLRETRRRKQTLIISITLTVVLIAGVVIAVIGLSSGDNKNNQSAGKPTDTTSQSASQSGSQSQSPSTSTSSAPVAAPAACAAPSKDKVVTFRGVTVKNPTDLSKDPDVTSTATTDPNALECMDLVVGKGKAANPTSQVTVHYAGVLYKDGTKFDSSWDRGQPAQFSLTGVVAGFTQGIGGQGKVVPMHEGGRRVMILPAALGYGATGQGTIPPNAALVFVVDLKSVDS